VAVRLYGHGSQGSFGVVTEGMRTALKDLGEYIGTVLYDDPDGATVPGADTPLSITCGAPMQIINAHLQGQHKQHWLLLAVNSDGIPWGLLNELRGDIYSVAKDKHEPLVDGFLAPSQWCEEVIRDKFPDKPVLLCQHGVFEHFKPDLEHHAELVASYYRGQFRVLHITSTYKDRKGTRELLDVWKDFCRPGTFLTLLVNPVYLHDMDQYVRDKQLPNVLLRPGVGLPEEYIIEGYNRHHVVCQPSRAEGFGLTPLESRACGTPVVATACTGHADHVHGPGTVIIPHGGLAPVDDFIGSLAPTVQGSSILDALTDARERWEALHEEALNHVSDLKEHWSWKNRTAPALKQLKKLIEP
jgi:glycosyltransferase involved in cell wall biosynthesis